MTTGTSPEYFLLIKLETTSGDFSNLHHHFSTFLHQFTTIDPSKPDQTLIRSLAKKHLSFLNKSISLLPKRIAELKSRDPSLRELFDCYKLCLNCMDVVSGQLACKPYHVSIQRFRMVNCLVSCELFTEAEDEAFSILERLREGSKSGRYVPEFGKESVDGEFGLLVVEIVVLIVKCAAANEGEDGAVYRRVMTLLEEVRPWFRGLDGNAYEKLHRILVTYLNKCGLFLVENLAHFEADLIHAFCFEALSECTKLPTKEQMHKFAHRICCSVFLHGENNLTLLSDLLICVLDTIAHECEVDLENNVKEFVKIISYCSNKCRTTTTRLCLSTATHINKLAGDFREAVAPLELILRIYANGLYLSNSNVLPRDADISTFESTKYTLEIIYFVDHEERLQSFVSLLGLLRNMFLNDGKETYAAHSKTEGKYRSIMKCHGNQKGYLLFYLNALQFLCKPLVELVNIAKKQLLVEDVHAPVSGILYTIQDAFLLLCDAFIYCQSSAFENESIEFDESDKLVLSGAVAAFTLSFRTKVNVKKTVKFIKHVLLDGRSQLHGLKFIFISLHNIGVILYKNKQLLEAAKTFQLSLRASWECVLLLCRMFVDKSKGLYGDLTEATIVNFATDACTKGAFLLDILHQSACHKVKLVITAILEKWSAARNLFEGLPSPTSLVKQWVKIECKLSKDDDDYLGPTLYCLLGSSAKVSKSAIGVLLDQELQAYEEMTSMYPKFCQRMQLRIMDILLDDVYVTNDSCLPKSKILIKKGSILRAPGIEGLKDCIQCFTEAISTLEDSYGDLCSRGPLFFHHLAVAYCLRALNLQEADPSSKQVSKDIHAALEVWLSMHIANDCGVDEQCNIVTDMTILLLYQIIDLLSLKGHIQFLNTTYKVIVRMFKWKNVSLDKCLAMLWEYRRLSHALCASPVNEAFILNLSEHCGEISKSMNYWKSCLEGSQPLVVGFQLNFSFLYTIFTQGSYHRESSFQSQITVGEVKKAAIELISSVPVPSHSVFLAGHLFYDLCERLVSTGNAIEALSYAKEAYRLRGRLFQEKFTYSIEKQKDHRGMYNKKPTNLQILSSVATKVCSWKTVESGFEGCSLTPWNVLQCYLESTLQVGFMHELVGNCAEAEILLTWGKNISTSQGLPLFIVAFSSVLGKLYREKQLWQLSAMELQNARKIMMHNSADISCLKCRMILEVTIDQQLGDLYRSEYNNCSSSIKKLYDAENLYNAALQKLEIAEWKNSTSDPKDVEDGVCCTPALCATDQPNVRQYPYKIERQETMVEAKRSRKSKKAATELPQKQNRITGDNVRITRSRSRATQNKTGSHFGEVQIGIDKCSTGNPIPDCVDTLSKKMSVLQVKNATVDLRCEVNCNCNKRMCWQCLPIEVMASGLLDNFIHLKWEFIRRRLFLRLLNGLGKCVGARGAIHDTHEVFLRSIAVLVGRNPFNDTHSSAIFSSFLHMFGKEIPGDVFAIERAAILQNICWYSLKNYHLKETSCCDLSKIQIEKVFSWLLLAFVLVREIPVQFQKVSRLLATVCLLSSLDGAFSFPISSCKTLSECHYAAFFHQASIGIHHNYQLLSCAGGKNNAQTPMDVEDSSTTESTSNPAESYNMLSFRLAPESMHDLDKFVAKFYESLPFATVVCLSFFGGDFAGLLNELLIYPSSVCSWMLLSRLNLKSQPVVVLLPVKSLLEDDDCKISGSGNFIEENNLGKQWECPWGSTVVDDVAPGFRLILQENYLSSSIFPEEDTKLTRSSWWVRRKNVDKSLGKLLRDMEDHWFGPLKYLLCGEWADSRQLGPIQTKLVLDLTRKCKLDVNESLVRVILGGARYADDKEECIRQLSFLKGCHVSRFEYGDDERCTTSSELRSGVKKLSGTAIRFLLDAVKEFEQEECLQREPVLLVLDCEVQMIPWENLPILRNQEIYRMPSIACIIEAFARSRQCQNQVESIIDPFPFIDPLDAFYLLNPSGDLTTTQADFENWFKDQNLEGNAGNAPTITELAIALKNHDLFIYFGHGSGAQYIPGYEIQKLDSCAATLLMGCSSGSLVLNGPYTPQGIPLSYLLAGSPAIVANLWEVTDKDIDRFGKAMLEAWLRERSNPFSGYDHRPKLGSFISQARDACTLPYLIGAAPVCYGIPTGIRKKKDV